MNETQQPVPRSEDFISKAYDAALDLVQIPCKALRYCLGSTTEWSMLCRVTLTHGWRSGNYLLLSSKSCFLPLPTSSGPIRQAICVQCAQANVCPEQGIDIRASQSKAEHSWFCPSCLLRISWTAWLQWFCKSNEKHIRKLIWCFAA